MVPPAKKLEDLIHLAELCVDLLQQNEEHYAEVISCYFSPKVFQLFHIITVTSGKEIECSSYTRQTYSMLYSFFD